MRGVEEYRSKVKTAEEAVGVIKSGDRVYIHQGCSEPETLVAAMLRRAPSLEDVEIIHLATMGSADYTLPQYEGHFRHSAFFCAANVRPAVQAGRADYIPIFLSEIEELFRSGAMPIDVALLLCTPPDRHGYMSLGTGIDVSQTVAECARKLIVEVNDQAPRTLGDSFIHASKPDALVEASYPLAELEQPTITPLHCAIARHVANLVPDGATIQTGIGGLPSAVLSALSGHRDLGVHTELFSDPLIDLIVSDVVNNERKSLHPHKVISGFVLGTRRLFEFINNNPIFEFHPTFYTNDPFLISRNDRMVAINSAIEVDLTGQVCADSIGYLPFSGIGGQVDFIRGAARSKGGVPIIALPATAKDGSVSRIVPALKPGAGVVTSRGDVHYIVTEFGAAYLHGKTLRQRAEALIAIAHPDFQDELHAAARETGILEARR
jgi:4-hydroxybutyrate CoA-transferase